MLMAHFAINIAALGRFVVVLEDLACHRVIKLRNATRTLAIMMVFAIRIQMG
jgi:hypothetical protein